MTVPQGGLSILMLLEGGDLPGHPGPGGWSGINRYWVDAIELIRARGHEVTVGTVRGRSPLHDPVERLGCKTFQLEAATSRGYPRAVRRFGSLVRKTRPDVLHLNESIQAVIGGIGGRISLVPSVYHRHHTQIEGRTRTLSRIASRLCDVTMCVSQAVARHAADIDHARADRVRIARNGIPDTTVPDASTVDALQTSLQIAADEFTLVIVGHLRPEKGHDVLFKAVERASRNLDRRIRVVVVGTGPLKDRLESTTLAEGASVSFVGHQEDVAPWYALGDAIVVPSLREPFGLVALEAMALSRPLIASRVDGLEEVVRDAGILVEPDSPDDLAAAISSVVADPKWASSLGEAGRLRYLSEFTLEKMVDRWLECYESARSGGAGR